MDKRTRTRFGRQVDPDGVLPADERDAMIAQAVKEYTAKMTSVRLAKRKTRKYDQYIRELVDDAPSLTAEQLSRLAALLAPTTSKNSEVA
jgi:hypothetical protein